MKEEPNSCACDEKCYQSNETEGKVWGKRD